jgi:hypothetical protein
MEKWRLVLIGCICLVLLGASTVALSQKPINNEDYKFKITAPEGFILLSADTPLYKPIQYSLFNEKEKIYLIVTARRSKFTDIKSYLDCSKEHLERDLQLFREDTSLRLIECRLSKFYSGNSTLLHFSFNAQYEGLNRCLIYFLHHRDEEIQVSFMYVDSLKQESMVVMDKVMQSLELY